MATKPSGREQPPKAKNVWWVWISASPLSGFRFIHFAKKRPTKHTEGHLSYWAPVDNQQVTLCSRTLFEIAPHLKKKLRNTPTRMRIDLNLIEQR